MCFTPARCSELCSKGVYIILIKFAREVIASCDYFDCSALFEDFLQDQHQHADVTVLKAHFGRQVGYCQVETCYFVLASCDTQRVVELEVIVVEEEPYSEIIPFTWLRRLCKLALPEVCSIGYVSYDRWSAKELPGLPSLGAQPHLLPEAEK